MVLWDALKCHAPTAMQDLQRQYGALLRYIAGGILQNPQDTEECISDILLRIWERIDRYDPDKGRFSAWITTVARNTALDFRRTEPNEALSDTLSTGTTPEQELLHKERIRQLKCAIAALPGDDRTLFYRKYYYLQSTAQIAAELAVSERAVEGRLYRLRKQLKAKLGGDFNG